MRRARFILHCIGISAFVTVVAPAALAFEGRINAVITQGNETNALLYTVGTKFLRIEVAATNWPNPVDIVDLHSGAFTLLFPHNRSFVRLKAVVENSSAPSPGAPAMPMPPGGLPPGIGPQSQSAPAPGVPVRPVMPRMPMPLPMTEKPEFEATGQKTNFLGLACERYEIKQRGETLEVWATDQLVPYQPYVRNQPHRFGPRRIEEQWAILLTARKLFPLRASLRFDNGAERFRFEVKSVTPQALGQEDSELFQPPTGYSEIEPLPF